MVAAAVTLHGCICRYLKYVVPVGALFSIVLWLGNACYLHLSVSFIQMLKASMPVAVFLVGVLLGTTKYSFRTAANMAVVGAGIALASYGEINFVLIGVVLQMIAIFCESFRIVLIQVRLLDLNGNDASGICCCLKTMQAAITH